MMIQASSVRVQLDPSLDMHVAFYGGLRARRTVWVMQIAQGDRLWQVWIEGSRQQMLDLGFRDQVAAICAEGLPERTHPSTTREVV